MDSAEVTIKPLSDYVEIDEARDLLLVNGVRIACSLVRIGIQPTAPGYWLRIVSVKDGLVTLEQKADFVGEDRSLLLQTMCAGMAKWEPFTEGRGLGEIGVGGFRYATHLDSPGRCPMLSETTRAALRRALSSVKPGATL